MVKRRYDTVSNGKKLCGRCRQIKPISEFDSAKARNCGLTWACKKCRHEIYLNYKPSEEIKEGRRKRKREYIKKNMEESWTDSTIGRHKAKGYKILFTRRELLNRALIAKICPICGINLNWSYGKGKMLADSPTLDRVNNEKEMRLDNTMIICNRCNKSKGTMTYNEFIDYCKHVSKLPKRGE